MKNVETSKQKIASFLFKRQRVYLTLNVFYFAFLLFSLYMEYNYSKLYESFLFSFYASYEDFQLWYPRFYLLAYLFIIGIKASTIILLAGIAYFLYSLSERRKVLFLYNKEKGFIPFMKYEGKITIIALLFYLVLYYSSNFFVPEEFHEIYQILIARGFLVQIIIQSIIVLSVHFDRVKNYLKNYLLFPSLPHNIAILRIVFFLYLIHIYLSKYRSVLPTVSLPTKVELPYIGWLIDLIPVNAEIYTFFIFAGIICCSLIVVGFKTRWFLLLNAVCVFYIMATPNFFGKLWHEQIVIWISWFFMFSRCYDVFSIDAKLSKTEIVKSADYTFPIRFIWLTFGIIYFWSGFHKLYSCGFDWALGRSMVNQVQLEWAQNYDLVPAIRIDKYPVLLYIGGLSAILFELGYFLLILKPRLRWIAAICGLMMHNIIGYFMYISFSHLLQAFYIFYVDFGKWFNTKTKNFPISKQYSKPAFYLGIFILCTNFYCGMNVINTYPFSSYPNYANLISDTLKIVHFDAKLSDGTTIDVHKIGKQNKFRWESYGWLEYNLIRDFEYKKDVSSRLNDYWQIWVNHNPELRECVSVNAYLAERPVAPEGVNQLKIGSLIGNIKTQEELISP